MGVLITILKVYFTNKIHLFWTSNTPVLPRIWLLSLQLLPSTQHRGDARILANNSLSPRSKCRSQAGSNRKMHFPGLEPHAHSSKMNNLASPRRTAFVSSNYFSAAHCLGRTGWAYFLVIIQMFSDEAINRKISFPGLEPHSHSSKISKFSHRLFSNKTIFSLIFSYLYDAPFGRNVVGQTGDPTVFTILVPFLVRKW